MIRLYACLMAFVTTTSVFAHQGEDAPATGIEISMGTFLRLDRSSFEMFAESGLMTGLSNQVVTGKTDLMGIGLLEPSLYVSWFPSDNLAIGSEFGFWRISGEGEYVERVERFYGGYRYGQGEFNFSILYLGGRGAFFLQSNAASGPYLLANGALLSLYGEVRDDYDEVQFGPIRIFATGAGMGYQWRVGPAFVMKAEGLYRHRLAGGLSGIDGFSLSIILGTRLSGR